MTVIPKHTDMTLAADVIELSDEQRFAILEFFAATPDGGYKAALQSIGIRATKAEARALLHGDEELREARFKAMGLDERSLFKQLGEIAGSESHKDQFRAVTWGLNAIHRWHENAGVEVDVSHSGNVTVEHERRLTLDDVIGFARKLEGSGDVAGGELPAACPLLPAPEDR